MTLIQAAAKAAYEAGSVTLGQAMAMVAAVHTANDLCNSSTDFHADFVTKFGTVGGQCLSQLCAEA